MTIAEMMKAQKAAMDAAEAILATAEAAQRPMTQAENDNYTTQMGTYADLGRHVQARNAQNTLRASLSGSLPISEEGRERVAGFDRAPWLTTSYAKAFSEFVKSRGRTSSEALNIGSDGNGGLFVPFNGVSAVNYEGGSTSGAPITPVVIEQSIIPLAPPMMAVRSLATVLPTSTDLKLPRKTAHGTAAIKSESGSTSNAFAGTDPTMEQFTLSAFMVGHIADISWELAEDVPAFLAYLQQDELLSIATLEEGYFVTGTGTGQAQGLKGNVGTGVTGVLVGTDTYAEELLAASYDVQAALNPVYDNPNTAWLMQKATGLTLRKQQFTDNKYNPVWTRDGVQDYFHGYPVKYSSSMDAIAAGNTPVLFGDFKSGYIIGDRGGSGISVKFLDQPKAQYGLLQVLSYRRVDGRVRRSEAIQPIVLHA